MKDHLAELDNVWQHLASLGSHLFVVVVSAGIAFSLPWAARQFLIFWSHVEHEKVLWLSVELAVAALLIVFLTFLRRSLKDRRLARVARAAGLVSCFHHQNDRVRRQIAIHKTQ